MKHLSLAALLLLTTATVHAQEPESEATEGEAGDAEQPEVARVPPPAPVDPGPSVEEIHNELRAFHGEMERGLNEKDIDAIVGALDENVIFTPMNGTIVRGPDEVRAYYERMLVGPDAFLADIRTTFEADDLSILHGGPEGQRSAIAFGQSDGHYELSDGTEFDVKAVWVTTLLRNDDGTWRIGSFSYSSSMFDNPILDMQRQYFMIGGGIALFVVFLLAFFVGRMRGRKSAKA